MAGCGGSTSIGMSRQLDDASVSAGGAGGAAGSSGNGGTITGSGGASSSTGGSTILPDAGPIAEAGSCGSLAVSNVTQGVSDVPSDGCSGLGGSTAPSCVGPPVAFSCPVVRGPGDSGTIRPGDQINVSVVATSDDTVNYPCFGLVADHGVVGGATLLYALPRTGWEFSVQIPSSLKPGTVVHFTAYVRSVSSLNSGACPNRLGRVDFDVTVD